MWGSNVPLPGREGLGVGPPQAGETPTQQRSRYARPPTPDPSLAGRGVLRDLDAMIPLAALALAVSTPADEAPLWEPALRAAEHDLCGKQVALLGENGFHGEGKSVAFRALLIRRLVTRCGY